MFRLTGAPFLACSLPQTSHRIHPASPLTFTESALLLTVCFHPFIFTAFCRVPTAFRIIFTNSWKTQLIKMSAGSDAALAIWLFFLSSGLFTFLKTLRPITKLNSACIFRYFRSWARWVDKSFCALYPPCLLW